jgi:hypothetical protein
MIVERFKLDVGLYFSDRKVVAPERKVRAYSAEQLKKLEQIKQRNEAYYLEFFEAYKTQTSLLGKAVYKKQLWKILEEQLMIEGILRGLIE